MKVLLPTIHCHACGYDGRVVDMHYGYQLWVLLLVPPMVCTVIGIPPAVILLWLLGDRSDWICPKCRAMHFVVCHVTITPEAESIWREAVVADLETFKRSKRLMLAVVMPFFVASMTFLIIMLCNM